MYKNIFILLCLYVGTINALNCPANYLNTTTSCYIPYNSTKPCPFEESVNVDVDDYFPDSVVLDKDCNCYKYAEKDDFYGEEPIYCLEVSCSNIQRNCRWSNSLKFTFCESYSHITNTKNCYCSSKHAANFFCKHFCPIKPDDKKVCTEADDNFEKYGKPSLHLKLSKPGEYILKIKNYKKIKQFSSGTYVHCENEDSLLDNRYNIALENKDLTIFYNFTINVGTVKCWGFVYPSMEKLSSNIVFVSSNWTTLLMDIPTDIFKNQRLTSVLNTETIYITRKRQLGTIATLIAGYENNITFDRYENISRNLNQLSQKTVQIQSLEKCLILANRSNAKELFFEPIRSVERCLTLSDDIIAIKCNQNYPFAAKWTIFEKLDGKTTEKLLGIANSEQSEIKDIYKVVSEVQLKSLKSSDINIISDFIEEKAKTIDDSEKVRDFVKTVSLIMNVDKDVLRKSQNEFNNNNRILKNTEVALETFAKSLKNDNYFTISENLNLQVINATKKVYGVGFYFDDTIEVFYDNSSIFNHKIDLLSFAVSFPDVLVEELSKNNVFSSAAYKNPNLFTEESGNKSNVNGWILSSLIPDFNTTHLSAPIEVIFKLESEYNVDHSCSFWEFGEENSHWVAEKVSDTQKYPGFHVCYFNHMTHFALIFDQPTSVILDRIALAGNIISLFAIAAIYITAIISREWRATYSAKIALSSCFPIIMQNILLFASASFPQIRMAKLKRENICVGIAALLQYSIISQFLWTLVLAFLQYRRFIVTFTNVSKHFMIKCFSIGWLIPILPPLITFFLSSSHFYEQRSYCFLVGNALYIGIMAPLALILMFNIYIFIRIFYTICGGSNIRCFKNEEKHILLCAKLAVFLFFLLGFTWIFGLLNVVVESMFFSVIFVLSVSFTGVIMFWFHVILNKEACNSWRKIYSRYFLRNQNQMI